MPAIATLERISIEVVVAVQQGPRLRAFEDHEFLAGGASGGHRCQQRWKHPWHKLSAHVISFRSTCFKARSRDAKKGPDDQATVTGDCEMSRSRLELANGIGKTCPLIAA